MNIRHQILVGDKTDFCKKLNILFQHGFVFRKERFKGNVEEYLTHHNYNESTWRALLIGYHGDCQMIVDVCTDIWYWGQSGYTPILIEDFIKVYFNDGDKTPKL